MQDGPTGYNAAMGDFGRSGVSTTQIDDWLLAGGTVLTASDRAARALATTIHRLRQATGATVWETPLIQDYRSFLHSNWKARCRDGRLLLTPAQEEELWAGLVAGSGATATEIGAPEHRIARLAMEAHERLCAYAPQFLRTATRSDWQQDAAIFSNWLEAFDATCARQSLVSTGRLAQELPTLLESEKRSPLLLVGFDRLLPAQRQVFEAWGEWREASPEEASAEPRFHAARDLTEELTACARWCNEKLSTQPDAKILVLAREISSQTFRGQMERIFAQHLSGNARRFEFSIGLPLARTALARGAMMALRWLAGKALKEHTVDWLLEREQLSVIAPESSALLNRMRILRRRGHEQPEWTLRAFLDAPAPALPESWTERIGAVHQKLNQAVHRAQTPLEWAESLPELLTEAGWPGHRTLSSADYQTMQSWKKSVEAAGSLGFDGRRTSLHGFLDALGRIQEEILFAPESSETPILVAGPAESAGLTADAIWFLGADEDHWPAPGSAHPFLPLAVQREAGMPHTSAQLDAEVIEAVTRRLLCTAPEVHFSYSALNKDAEVRPSRILLRLVGRPTPLNSPSSASETAVQTILFPDTSKIPFTQISISGGAAVLTAQSNCPFRAFATARLAAKSWEAAQDGLTASQRGQLLHAVLHSIWSGPPRGRSSLQDLLRIGKRAEFVSKHVNEALHTEFHAELRARLPQRYLELEAERMTRLITQWMDYEAARAEFSVESREVDRTISLAGITIRLRLDRLDRLNDGSVLVIDYKSGDVKPSTWELPRPEDVQLPLYAGFALDRDTEPLGGLVFAKIRPGQQEFVGRVADAKNTLRPELKGTAALLKKPLEIEDLEAWRACIEQLTADFVAGKADVDPKDAPKSCEHCNLQSLCRIGALHSDDEEEEDA